MLVLDVVRAAGKCARGEVRAHEEETQRDGEEGDAHADV